MKIDGFLKVPDIPGESTRAGHEDEIDIHSIAYGLETATDRAAGVAARGRVTFDTVVVSKVYDRSSPQLMHALATNRRLDEVVISVRRTVEGETSDYLVISLSDASVVSYDVAPAEDQDDILAERVGFSYRRMRVSYDGQHEVELEVRPTR